MVLPGYYQTNPRAMSLRDLIGLGRGGLRLPFAWLVTRFMRPRGGSWMPSVWAESECQKEQLSVRFWEITSKTREALGSLGFKEYGFSKVWRTLDPSHRDNGGITYLDATHRHVALLAYAHAAPRGPTMRSLETVVTAFSAVFAGGLLQCTNNKIAFAPLARQRTIRFGTDRIDALYERFLKELGRSGKAPLEFPDKQSLVQWFDSNQVAVFEDRVRRGLFVRMSDAEIEAARSKLPRPDSQSPLPSLRSGP